jgi:hypothetical protein
MTPPLRILLLANCDHDRRDLAGWIASRPETTEILAYHDLSAVIESGLRTGDAPRLVVLSAGFTQAWSLEEFAQLWNELPLARWIIVQNGWSDSALRHWPWLPPGCCVPRERLEIRLRQELNILLEGADPLPHTASLEETFEHDAALPENVDLSGQTVTVFTPDRDLRSSWTAFLESYGAQLVSLEQSPSAVLWDCDPWQKDRVEQLQSFRGRDPACRIIGLRNIVHDLAEQTAKAAGVDVLLPKQLSGALILEALATRSTV